MTTKPMITMKCPSCGAAELVHHTRDTPYTYKSESTTLPAVSGDFCPACGEAVLDAKESRRVNTLMREPNDSDCDSDNGINLIITDCAPQLYDCTTR
jgi:YgiT-type zinc finger domain-containing protein